MTVFNGPFPIEIGPEFDLAKILSLDTSAKKEETCRTHLVGRDKFLEFENPHLRHHLFDILVNNVQLPLKFDPVQH